MRIIRGFVLSCAALAFVSPLHGQSSAHVNARQGNPSGGFTVSGTIADQDGNAISDAEIGVLKHDAVTRRVRSDSAGHFAVANLSDSLLTLRVRRFGFAPRDVAVSIPVRARTTTVMVTLEPMSAQLNGMTVNDTSRELDDRLRAFNERRAANDFAHFIDQDAIAQRRPQYISEMLRAIPGVLVTPGRLGYNVKIRGCAPLVWVDGVRVPGAQLDEVARPDNIAGIEIYSSFAGIPAQYFDRSATCGTILVWTRAR